jgi:hypothetical protein
MYAHGDAQIPTLHLAEVRQLRGITPTTRSLPHGNVTIRDSGQAILCLDGHFMEPQDDSEAVIEVELADGSIITTKDAYVTHQETSLARGQPARLSTNLELTEWQRSTGAEPVAWIGFLRGAEARRACNLCIRGNGKRSYNSLRLDAHAAWHLVRKGVFGRRTYVAIIDTKGAPVDRAHLWNDFAALEFLFGTPLRLDVLVGVDEKNEAVAAYGASFGYRFLPDANHEPPLPDERDATWMAVAFPLVARALREPEPNPATIATCGYVDSTNGHIDGQYLFAQVALESVAERLTTEKRPLVKDVGAWEAWVKSQRSLLAQHAVDAAAINVLALKLRDAAKPTSSRLVQQTLQQMGVVTPEDGLAEIDGRNVVAHTLSITDGKPYDFERDVRRVRIIRTLIAAMILRHVRYEGALVGWDLDERGWPLQAAWFTTTHSAREAARQIYEANAEPNCEVVT